MSLDKYKQIQNIVCKGFCLNSPTKNPTKEPSQAPTESSSHPTNNPTKYPSTDPTIDPTFEPTMDPTDDPTSNPTSDPTNDPTSNPTMNPSPNPTRKPTRSDPYDLYIDVMYGLRNVSLQIIQYINNNFIISINNIRLLIEQGYVEHQSPDIDGWALEYFEFLVKIDNINSKSINDITNDSNPFRTLYQYAITQGLILKSRILCNRKACDDLLSKYDKNRFENITNILLNEYFIAEINVNAYIQGLVFTVESEGTEALELDITKEEQESFFENHLIWIIIGISVGSICVIIIIVYGLWQYCKKKRELEEILAKTIKVRNPMVIFISIGVFDSQTIENLDGIRQDVYHCVQFFGFQLNYHIFPNYFTQNKDDYKVYWTRKQVID